MKDLRIKGRIVATDISAASPAYHTADERFLVPSVGRMEYIPALLRIVRENDIGLLVPVTDLDLRSLARQRDKFAEQGCTVMIGSEQVVRCCRDKSRINELLDAAGLPTIRTVMLKEFRRDPFYPCFVKPARGSGGVGARICENADELKAHLPTIGDRAIVQDVVRGREYTIDVYRSRDGEVRSVVPRQRLVVRSGEVEKGITVNDPDLIDATVKLSGMLDELWGVFCCQCRRDDGGPPRFFEINPRFGGGVLLSIQAGANLPRYLIEELLEKRITAKLGEFTDRLMMMRYDEAVFTEVEDPPSLPGYDTPQFR